MFFPLLITCLREDAEVGVLIVLIVLGGLGLLFLSVALGSLLLLTGNIQLSPAAHTCSVRTPSPHP